MPLQVIFAMMIRVWKRVRMSKIGVGLEVYVKGQPHMVISNQLEAIRSHNEMYLVPKRKYSSLTFADRIAVQEAISFRVSVRELAASGRKAEEAVQLLTSKNH